MADKAMAVAADVGSQFTFEAMQRMAQSMAKSQLFGVKDADQALSLMLIAQAEGRHPALAARDYHIIQNRPSLKADTLLSRFQSSGGSVQWHTLTDAKVDATFTHPQGGSARIDWTMERAKQAGLTGKDNWKAYPRAMLRSRVVSEGVRTVFPGVAVGIYTPEEIQDGAIDITPEPISQDRAVAEIAAAHNALSTEDVEPHVDAMMEAETLEALQAAYSAARAHAKQAADKAARDRFTTVYNLRAEHFKAEAAKGVAS